VLVCCASVALCLDGGPAAADGALKRVLILQSFGSDFAPYNALSASFRSGLAQSLGEPVEFHEISVQGTSSLDPALENALVGYLTALNADRPPDLVVAIGGQAGRFALSRRDAFPATPVLFAGLDQRFVPPGVLTTNDAAVPTANDVPAAVENILQVLPRTETVAVILGSSPLERYWRAELGRELEPLENRVHLLWWNELSGKDLLARAADLPPRSAILYVLFHVDAAGIPHASSTFLARLGEAASAPLFGIFDTQLGQGIVGGPLISISTLSHLAVEAAARILRGEAPASCRYPAVAPGPPVYDWRELQRWHIRERNLPPGSTARFRSPSAWVQYRWPVLGGLSIIAILAGLVIGLLLHRARRRVAEREVRALSQRLLTAFEDERRWLARELHDDLAQRLARLAIDAARLERDELGPSGSAHLGPLRDEIVSMSSNVHALSRRLHPSLLDNLGLAEALRAEADRFATEEPIAVEVRLDELDNQPSADAGLCLYRVAQESLRNVAEHAAASRVSVWVQRRAHSVALEVADDGQGFDPTPGGDTSLPWAREKEDGTHVGLSLLADVARSAGARLELSSGLDAGTTVRVEVTV
jgi:signal transduction histidine kinase